MATPNTHCLWREKEVRDNLDSSSSHPSSRSGKQKAVPNGLHILYGDSTEGDPSNSGDSAGQQSVSNLSQRWRQHTQEPSCIVCMESHHSSLSHVAADTLRVANTAKSTPHPTGLQVTANICIVSEDSPVLPSVGSALHSTMDYKPCAYFHSKVGCLNSTACEFCHFIM